MSNGQSLGCVSEILNGKLNGPYTNILSEKDQKYNYFIGTMNQSLRVEGIETNETTGEKFKLTYDIEADLKNGITN